MKYLNVSDYRKLLTLSTELDPLDSDFTEKTASALRNIFGFSKAELIIFSDNSCIYWKALESDPKEPYQKDINQLKNENSDCIGLLFIYQDKSLSCSQNQKTIQEITKLVERALQTHIHFYRLKSNVKILKNLVSHLSVAIILCDDNFHILQINQTAKKYIDLFHKSTSQNEAEKILRNNLLTIFINSGECEYSVPVGDYVLQLSIRSHVINEIRKCNYTTCYQITMTCMAISNEVKWNEFLRKKKLTKREFEICNLLRLGNTNDEISDSLHISINTIKRHRESIYRKLNISRINQLNIFYENSISREDTNDDVIVNEIICKPYNNH